MQEEAFCQGMCVVIRQTHDGELRENPLSTEMLKRCGIVNAQVKAYGRRTPYNVVQATSKALIAHESIERKHCLEAGQAPCHFGQSTAYKTLSALNI